MRKTFFTVAAYAFAALMLLTSAFAEDMPVKEGDAAPDFSIESTDGKVVSLKDLKGKKIVLWFYPKDDTPG